MMHAVPISQATDNPASSFTTDVLTVLGGAVAGTAIIVTLWDRPLPALLATLMVLAAMLWRFHSAQDLVGLWVGVSFGNLTEFLCDVAGVWIHAERSVAGVSPPYIFVCYPILGLTVPRLMAGLMRQERPAHHGQGSAWWSAGALWALHVAMSFVFGQSNDAMLFICLALLALTLTRFHDRHDLACAAFGGVLGLVWELPATLTGAWRFPSPQVLGLIPVWLPLAYAIFFANLGRITAALVRALAPAGQGRPRAELTG